MAIGQSVEVVPLLWVNDIEESISFYANLGFELQESWKPDGSVRWCSVKFGNAEVMLQQSDAGNSNREDSKRSEEIELYFVCKDVEALHERYIAAGVEVSKPKVAFYGMNQMFVTDPDGRTLCFESRIRE